jgi:hypothetical protein
MNVILNPQQSDTKSGAITLTSTSDMTGKESQAVKIVNTAGVAQFALPAAITDMAVFIVASGDVAANETAAESPNLGENCRVAVNGACVAGDLLCLDPNAYGKFYKPAGGSGATVAWFIAEETAAAGGLCKARRIGPYPFTP